MNSIFHNERKIMRFFGLSRQHLYQLCYCNFNLIQAHCSFYVIWHVVKSITNLTEIALAGHKKVVWSGIIVSNPFPWSTLSQRNGLIQWYEKHVSVLTIITGLTVPMVYCITKKWLVTIIRKTRISVDHNNGPYWSVVCVRNHRAEWYDAWLNCEYSRLQAVGGIGTISTTGSISFMKYLSHSTKSVIDLFI